MVCRVTDSVSFDLPGGRFESDKTPKVQKRFINDLSILLSSNLTKYCYCYVFYKN